jgi:hypothetical protein
MELTMLALFMLVFGKVYATKPVEEMKKVNKSNIKKLVHATVAIADGLFDRLNLGDHVDAHVTQPTVSKSLNDHLQKCYSGIRSDITIAMSNAANGKAYALRAATTAMLAAIFVGSDVAKESAKSAYFALASCGYKQIANRMLAVLSSSVEKTKDGKSVYTMTATDPLIFSQIYGETAEYYAVRMNDLLCHDIDYTKTDDGKLSGLTEISAKDTSNGLAYMWELNNLKGKKTNTAKKASNGTSIADMTEDNIDAYLDALKQLAKSSDTVRKAFLATAMEVMHNI